MTVLVGGHAEVLLHVLAKEAETDEIQLYANLLDTHIRLEEQAFDFLYGQIVDDNLRRLAGDSVADYGQVFRRDSQTVGIPPNLTLTAFVFLQQAGKIPEKNFLPPLLVLRFRRLFDAFFEPAKQFIDGGLRKDAADVLAQSRTGVLTV